MNLRKLAILILIMATSGCGGPDSTEKQEGIKKERIADGILKKTAAELKHQANLEPIGTIGQMLNDIQLLGLSFYYYKPVDISEGRKLLIRAANLLMKDINQEKKIHPYLAHYPFHPRNIEIRIIFRNPDGREVSPGSLWGIVASEGNLCYNVHDTQNNNLVAVYKETFEQALERIADPTLPLVAFEPDREISQEEFHRLKSGISFVSDDGAIWHLGENGSWVRD